MYNPIRRNRNIGTPKSGHGQNNRLTIARLAGQEYEFWELLNDTQEVSRTISGTTMHFFVQRTRADCVHACTVDDLAYLISHIPKSDWKGLAAVVLRQPRRKEQTLAPVWGRLAYSADLVNAQRLVLYSGAAIFLEAIDPSQAVKFGKTLSPDGQAELERLQNDGHMLRRGDRLHTLDVTLTSCRNTQLYRTFLHELGHWVEFLRKVERPAASDPDNSELYEQLLSEYHARPSTEKERFAHTYAKHVREQLSVAKIIPFERRITREGIFADGLTWEDFATKG